MCEIRREATSAPNGQQMGAVSLLGPGVLITSTDRRMTASTNSSVVDGSTGHAGPPQQHCVEPCVFLVAVARYGGRLWYLGKSSSHHVSGSFQLQECQPILADLRSRFTCKGTISLVRIPSFLSVRSPRLCIKCSSSQSLVSTHSISPFSSTGLSTNGTSITSSRSGRCCCFQSSLPVMRLSGARASFHVPERKVHSSKSNSCNTLR